LERGRGVRCAGFIGDDPNWARCERSEHAGDLPLDERTTPPTYAHRLIGECRCGTQHGASLAPTGATARRTTIAAPPRRVVATYPYRSASGEIVYRKLRYEPKSFSFQHPTADGGWAKDLNGAAHQLYRLPELLAEPLRTAWIPEGERDVETLVAAGLLATTTDGLRTWRPEYAEHFRGRQLAIVLPDNDAVGLEHAQRIAASLHAVGCPVVVLELPGLPPKGDVSDFMETHTVDVLKALAQAAPRWTPPVVAESALSSSDGIGLVPASSVRPERVAWASDQRVPLGMLTLLVGEGGLGKSMESVRLAAGWSRGTIPGDLFGVPVNVAIASAEDHRAAVIVPRLQAAGADLGRIHFVQQLVDGIATDIDIDGEVDRLESVLEAAAVRVLIVDTVVAHIPSQHDSFKEQSVRRVLKPLHHMAERANLGVVGVMHLNRRDARDVLTRISGSGAFGNLARQVLLFARDPDDPNGPTRILAVGKSNVGAHAPTLKLQITPDTVPADDGEMIPTARLVVVGETDQTASQLLGPSLDDEERGAKAEAMDFLTGLLGNGEPVEAKTVKAVATDAGITNITLRRAAKALGVKTNDRAGFGPGFPSRWRLVAQPDPYMLLPETRATREDDEQVGKPVSSLHGQEIPTLPSKTNGQVGEIWPSREASDPKSHDVTLADVVTRTLPEGMRHSACPRCGVVATVLAAAADSLCAGCMPLTPRVTQRWTQTARVGG